jgi:hypothetical protein
MPGGSVYNDHTFNKETAHISHKYSTIHRTNFQVQYKYMNIPSTIQYIYISTIQVHEHYKSQDVENAEKH